MKAGHPDRSYAAVWAGDVLFEASPLLGLDPTTHLQRCRELVSQGYRMVSLSVARISPEGSPVTASVWHRPVITEEAKDQLAERQARAAIALLRMGKAAEVMPLLRHSADPRLRSFIVNWLNPLGADPKTLAAELDRLRTTAKPTPAEGQQFMDAVLFHPETSQRRALILALGTYGTEGLSPGEREPLIGKLLDLYRNDPDSRHPRGGSLDFAAMEAAGEAQGTGCPVDEGQGSGRPQLVRQRSGSDLRRDRGTGRVPHGIATDRAGSDCPR